MADDDVNKKIVVDEKSYFDRYGKVGATAQNLKEYIVNIYYVLMTRGIKGTYLYICDHKLRLYMKQYIDEIFSQALEKYFGCVWYFGNIMRHKSVRHIVRERRFIMNIDMTKKMEMVLYRTEDDNVTVSALIKDESIWLTQKAMAELFGIDKSGVSRHLSKIFETNELKEEVVVAKIATTTQHGAIQNKTQTSYTNYYNLDAIISVGYRVNSIQATQFRIWATNVLKEYMIKGFAMDDERLKQGKYTFGKDYFNELLERVRSIRASERRIWQQITDIYAECSVDYDRDSDITYRFYATIQNKFHFAITGRTAAEIVYNQADHTKENMGLTTWKNAPNGRILKSDAQIAKNYLTEKQIKQLERAVVGYFDYIEDLIERENVFTMEEFSKSVNEFLEFRKYDILKDNGKISHKQALDKAHKEYEMFNKIQPIESDFDKIVKKLR